MLSKSHIPIIQQAGTILGLHPAKIVVVGTGFKCEDELIDMLRLNAYPTTYDGGTALLPIKTPKGHIATNKAKGASASAGGLFVCIRMVASGCCVVQVPLVPTMLCWGTAPDAR